MYLLNGGLKGLTGVMMAVVVFALALLTGVQDAQAGKGVPPGQAKKQLNQTARLGSSVILDTLEVTFNEYIYAADGESESDIESAIEVENITEDEQIVVRDIDISSKKLIIN